jgi:hydroxypyruvate isomerase
LSRIGSHSGSWREVVACTQDVHKQAYSPLFALVRLPGINNLLIPGPPRAYDFYHQQRGLPQGGGVVPLLAPLHANVDLLGLVHVADVPGRHAPGTGVIDYAAIYRGLRKEGYRGWMAMEFLPTGDAAEELHKAAAETAEYTKPTAN